MATMEVKDANGNKIAIEKPLAPGRVAQTLSLPVVLSTEDKASLDAIAAKIIAAPATAAAQTAGNSSLTSIDTKLTSAATAANQGTGNTSLTSIDTKLTAGAKEAKQDLGNNSLTSIDNKLTTVAKEAKQDTGNTSLTSIDTKLTTVAKEAKQDAGNTLLTAIDAKLGAATPAGANLIGSVNHATTGIGSNRQVVATPATAVALAASTAAKWVIVVAELDNTGVVAVGGANVLANLSTRRGVPLTAGESVTMPVDNLADVFIDAVVATEGVTFMYGT